MSDIHRHRSWHAWPEQQRPDTRDGQREPRELPASNPAELAAYHAAGNTTDPGDEAGAAFVDLGFSDNIEADIEGAFAQPANGDEFGSGSDSGADDEQVALDAA